MKTSSDNRMLSWSAKGMWWIVLGITVTVGGLNFLFRPDVRPETKFTIALLAAVALAGAFLLEYAAQQHANRQEQAKTREALKEAVIESAKIRSTAWLQAKDKLS